MISRAEAARMADSPWRSRAMLAKTNEYMDTNAANRAADLAVITARNAELEALRQRRSDHQAARELRSATREAWQQ
ncbi:hypothetical protein [Jeongeupia sp. USM3]|uniref:hypothetical protein n=1 Tax=Jeongeupia sp. USM3 TaxID=1906741 RepID=UPI00089DE140|nr:hypothetical protein [Jeongeupia sp. USM3]AOY00127.1 hypothetical protein BJP62_06475 [Jeongeupia sp. USM3]